MKSKRAGRTNTANRTAQPFSGRSKMAMLACGAIAVAGLIAQSAMSGLGLPEASEMESAFSQGMPTSTFILLVEFGAGGAIASSCIAISQEESLMPYIPMMQSVAIAGGIGGIATMLVGPEGPLRMLTMLMSPNIASPLFWDMVVLIAFIAIEVIGLAATAQSWKSERAWAIIGLLAGLALQLVEGLLFALMSARAWWHSAIIPIDFIVVAGICGLSLTLILSAASHREESMQAADLIARTLLWLVVVHAILSLCEVIGLSLDSTAESNMALSLIGSYIVVYMLEIALPVIGIAIALIAKRKDMFILGGALAIGGMIAQAHIPSAMELVSALLPVGIAGLVALLAYNLALASNGTREKDPQKAQSHRRQDEL